MLATVSFTAILLLSAAADSTRTRPASAPAIVPVGTTCHRVNAVLNAQANHISPALKGLSIRGTGVSTGDVIGPVKVEVLKPYIGKSLDVSFTITTATGDLVARGKAIARRDSTPAGGHSITTDTDVRDGNGAFKQSSGAIKGQGHVDTKTRRIEIVISGDICTASPPLPLDGGAR